MRTSSRCSSSFAGAGFVVIGDVSVRVRPDMNVEQKRLAVLDEAVGVFEVGLALADRLDLSAAQGHAGLESLQQEVVVAGGAVMRGVAFAGGDGIARTRSFWGADPSGCRSRGWSGGPWGDLLRF